MERNALYWMKRSFKKVSFFRVAETERMQMYFCLMAAVATSFAYQTAAPSAGDGFHCGTGRDEPLGECIGNYMESSFEGWY